MFSRRKARQSKTISPEDKLLANYNEEGNLAKEEFSIGEKHREAEIAGIDSYGKAAEKTGTPKSIGNNSKNRKKK